MNIFFSVTIERQQTEIRLRIRNLTTDDQGWILLILVESAMIVMIFLMIGTWECIGMDTSNRQIRKSFQLNIKGKHSILENYW